MNINTFPTKGNLIASKKLSGTGKTGLRLDG